MLGDRKLSVFPVAISLMTSCLSGLSLLGSSSEVYYQGPTYSFVALALLICGPITAYTILPVFYKLNELSLYRVSCLKIAGSHSGQKPIKKYIFWFNDNSLYTRL